MLQACVASKDYKALTIDEKKNAIKSVFYMGYFNRVLQSMFSQVSPRLTELKAIPKSVLTHQEKLERDSEEQLLNLGIRVSDFGALVCGLKSAEKITAIVATKSEIASGTAFYQAFTGELLTSANITV